MDRFELVITLGEPHRSPKPLDRRIDTAFSSLMQQPDGHEADPAEVAAEVCVELVDHRTGERRSTSLLMHPEDERRVDALRDRLASLGDDAVRDRYFVENTPLFD